MVFFFCHVGCLLTRNEIIIFFKYGDSLFNENECPNESMQGFKNKIVKGKCNNGIGRIGIGDAMGDHGHGHEAWLKLGF
jgi:hypothetical protein